MTPGSLPGTKMTQTLEVFLDFQSPFTEQWAGSLQGALCQK